jgi:hypothetical protein
MPGFCRAFLCRKRQDQLQKSKNREDEAKKNMKSFGIFDGAAREDSLVAAAVYFYPDYEAIYGSGVDSYRDYLLRRHNFLAGLAAEEPVRIVHVPFDPECYAFWLRNNAHWEDGPEARGAWALEVAKNPAALGGLFEKHPTLPAAPVEEELTASVLFGAVPAFFAGPDEGAAAGRRLSRRHLAEVAKELRAFFAEAPDFQRLSPLRCRGLRVFVGERLVPPERAIEAAGSLEDAAKKALAGSDPILPVPSGCRVKRPDFPDDVGEDRGIFAPLLFPVVLAGAASEVEYAGKLLEAAGHSVEGVTGAVYRAIEGIQTIDVGSDILFMSAYEVLPFLQDMLEDILFEEKKSGLRRIK